MANSTLGTALVTDAASRIGAIYADRLARRGYDLLLVARDRRRLHDLSTRLAEETGRTINVVAADLSENADLERIESLLRSNSGISLLVNSASAGAAAPPSDSDVGKIDDMIALNVRALTRLSSAAIPGFITRGGGTIINVASAPSIAPEILSGAYAGTRAFVAALSLLLHKELAAKNVRVQSWEIG